MRHSRDPQDPSLAELERRWASFVERRGEQPAVALVEGRVRGVAADRRAAILDVGGEGGLLALLAHRAQIPLRCPEPPWPALVAAQLERFDADTVCHAYCLRALAHWHHAGRPGPWAAYLVDIPPLPDLDCDLSREAVQRRHREIFGRPLAAEDASVRFLVDPGSPSSPLAPIMAHDILLRDVHAVRVIGEELAAGRHVFVAYGMYHVLMQEPALRQLLGA